MKKILLLGVWMLLTLNITAQDVFVQKGKASYYADKFDGRQTANGEIFRQKQLTAAHLTLPFGTIVKVTNLTNSKTVTVRVNDRGPFVEGRIIDLSRSAAQRIGGVAQGIMDVKIEVVGKGVEVKKETVKPAKSNMALDNEYYSVSSSREQPKGFGVQIGSFKEMANLIKLADGLKKMANEKVLVQVASVNQVKVYRIVVGEVKDKHSAESIKRKLKRKYPDCFIVSYN